MNESFAHWHTSERTPASSHPHLAKEKSFHLLEADRTSYVQRIRRPPIRLAFELSLFFLSLLLFYPLSVFFYQSSVFF